MAYTVYNASGEPVAGSEMLDAATQGAALIVNGWVEDEAGRVFYESPRRQEVRSEHERIATEQAARQAAAVEPEPETESETEPEPPVETEPEDSTPIEPEPETLIEPAPEDSNPA